MKRIQKFLHFIFKGSLFLGTLLFLAFGGLSLRLYQGPISLKEWTPRIQQAVGSLSPDLTLKVENPELSWGSWRKPFVIRAREVKIEHRQGDAFEIDIPEIQMTFRMTHLLIGRLTPYAIEADKARVSVNPDFLSETQREPLSKEPRTIYEQFLSILDELPAKKIRLSHVSLEISDSLYTKAFKVEDLSFYLKKGLRSFAAELSFQIHKTTLTGELNYNPAGGELDFALSLINYEPTVFEALKTKAFREKSFYPLLDEIGKQTLKGSFEMKGLLNLRQRTVETATLKLSGLSGELYLKSLMLRPLKIKGGHLEAVYEDGQILSKTMTLQVDNIEASARFSGSFHPKEGCLSVGVQAEAQKVPFDDLQIYWPKGLADVPRDWVTRRISKGLSPKATLISDLRLFYDDQGLRIVPDKVEGEIRIKNTSVRYMDDLPPVTNIEGIARYTNKEMSIDLKEGACGKIVLKSGQILISGLDQKDQEIALRLNVTSPVKEAVAFIEQKPLEFAQKFRLKSQYVLGQVEDMKLLLRFPLERSLTLAQVKADVKARIKDFTSKSPLKGLKADILHGHLDLSVTNDGLSVEGDLQVSGIPSHLVLKQDWRARSEPVDLTLKSALHKTLLEQNQVPGIDAFIGEIPYTLTFKGSDAEGYHLDVSADLTPATIHAYGWEKQGKVPGTLTVEAASTSGGDWTIHSLKGVCGNSLQIEASGAIRDGRIKRLDLKSFRLGETDLHGRVEFLETIGHTVLLEGPRLNLEPFMLLSKGKKTSVMAPLKVTMHVDRIDLGKDRYLLNNDLFFRMSNGLVRQLTYKAMLASKSKEPLLRAVIESGQKTGERKLTISSDHAGKVLKAFNVSDNVSGGKLKIIATHEGRTEGTPWRGKLQIKDFALKEAPLMSKLLTLAFPTGIIDLMSDKGLVFRQFKVNFGYTPSRILLKEGRAHGISLGMTVNGTIDRNYDQLNLQGSVIPAQMLNTILSKVPLVGELLTGGKHEGLFAISYSIEGPTQNPHISVNPISALTPGFLRKIFDKKESGQEFEIDDKDGDRDLETQ